MYDGSDSLTFILRPDAVTQALEATHIVPGWQTEVSAGLDGATVRFTRAEAREKTP